MSSPHSLWVEGATPVAPVALTTRVVEVLDMHREWDTLPLAEALTSAGEVLLGEVLGRNDERSRDNALDLLAADACVTWAFEVAAEAPESLGARAQLAMQRIAEVAS